VEKQENVSRETIGAAMRSRKSRKGLLLLAEAFLLAALCFAVYQWNGAVKETEALQEQVSTLQIELAEALAAAETFQDANETSRNQASHMEHVLERTQEAMEQFWQLETAYLRGGFSQCRTVLEAMEQNADDPMEQYLTPEMAERYQEIAAVVSGASN